MPRRVNANRVYIHLMKVLNSELVNLYVRVPNDYKMEVRKNRPLLTFQTTLTNLRKLVESRPYIYVEERYVNEAKLKKGFKSKAKCIRRSYAHMGVGE